MPRARPALRAGGAPQMQQRITCPNSALSRDTARCVRPGAQPMKKDRRVAARGRRSRRRRGQDSRSPMPATSEAHSAAGSLVRRRRSQAVPWTDSDRALVDPNLVEHVDHGGPCGTRPRCSTRSRDQTSPIRCSPCDRHLPGGGGAGAAGASGRPRHARRGIRHRDRRHLRGGAQEVARLLESLGHHVTEFAAPVPLRRRFAEHSSSAPAKKFSRMLKEVAAGIGRPIGPTDVEAFSWALASASTRITDEQYAAAQTWERAYAAHVRAGRPSFDVLLTPTAGEPPVLLDELIRRLTIPSGSSAFPPDLVFLRSLQRDRPAGDLASAAATPSGLPIGVQLVAGLGREDLLLRVAAQLERARPWKSPRPCLPA